ncbi:MAG TPA: hypothetical protein VMV47_08385 [Bacteroidales bacterium]|nr:hypothetical protein [Bacteroidales bacterium]
MEKNLTTADDLKTIRKIMEESTKFLSLSGFSGVLLGLFAIAGALFAYLFILDKGSIKFDEYIRGISVKATSAITLQLMIDACSVLILSLLSAFYFSFIKAKRSGKSMWTPVSKRLLINLLIPLVTGGTFVLILLFQNQIQLIIPGLLIFYGLALVNAGKFTYDEIFYLGILEIITGLISAFFLARGLVFWILGFGILHIVYGIFMYRKYEV